MEIWKPIKDFEGLYEVSNYGRVKALEKEIEFKTKNQFCEFSTKYKTFEKILKPIKHSNGYYVISLSYLGVKKIKAIHRLVAEAFIENPLNKPQVNHKDGNKGNNNADNLEWVTQSENTRHAYTTGLLRHYTTPISQFDLNGNFIKQWASIKEAAQTLNIVESGIAKCCCGKRKKSGGYMWGYAK